MLCIYMQPEVWYQRYQNTVLFYALILPGGGRDASPLPVCEMLSNGHGILSLPLWLMQFQLKLPKYTSLKIQEVETNDNQALVQEGVPAFNRERIDLFWEKNYAVCERHGQKLRQ